MVPIYEKARQIKGRGSGPKDRVKFFDKKVSMTGEGVWMKAHDYLREELHRVLTEHAECLKSSTRSFFVGIDQKFNIMCSDKELEDAEETLIRDKLQKNLIRAKDLFESEVRSGAKACFGDL